MILPIPWPNRALSLQRYAEIIGVDLCAFWGIYYDGQEQFQCYTRWTEHQRMTMARAIAEAENLIEGVLGYALSPRWYTEDQALETNPMLAQVHKVIAGGIRAQSSIQYNAPISYASEPATVGPIATALIEPSEIRIYYPGTEREITPAQVTIAGGLLTIRIPRYQLAANPYNPIEGYDYADLNNFLAGVDVGRVYNDTTTMATLVERRPNCADATQAACLYVRNPDMGEVAIGPYNAAAFMTGPYLCGQGYNRARLYYKAGLTQLDPLLEDAIVRLAHARMPTEPCGCDITQRLWKRDRDIPQVVTRERINCPFGANDGAWAAWKIANRRKIWRMGVM